MIMASSSTISKYDDDDDDELYDPLEIFINDNRPMSGGFNVALGKSFYHNWNGDYIYTGRNAGALQLYKVINSQGWIVPWHVPRVGAKEYNAISKPWDEPFYSYYHSERFLMKAILDDIIPNESTNPQRPSKDGRSERDALMYLADIVVQQEYKKYLKNQNLIVKMWSERPPCSNYAENMGGSCSEFIRNICPEGSQFGHILPRNCYRYEEESILTKAWEMFKKAYDDYSES